MGDAEGRTSVNHSNPVALIIPAVSSDDFAAFFQDHFVDEAVARFGLEFLDSNGENGSANSQVPAGWEEEVEDDLGYYEDGVKRTLTDEQIEIFRHSELQELLRQRKNQEKKRKEAPETLQSDPADCQQGNTPNPSTSAASFRNKRKKKGSKRQTSEPKPDLRKRTWDVVDKGLDSLDYD